MLSDPPLDREFRILYAGLTVAALLAIAAAARLPRETVVPSPLLRRGEQE
jgi:hypothetical protein